MGHPSKAEKRCSRCGETKPLDEFHRDRAKKDGRQRWCAPCARAANKAYREANPQKVAEAARRQREKNPQAQAERVKRWRENNRERVAEHERQQRERYPEKNRARRIVRKAVYEGRISKPVACEECGATTPKRDLHGHHDDYLKPMEVRWLCRNCHLDAHDQVFSAAKEAA